MGDADKAYERAQQEIARVKAAGADKLDFSGQEFHALDRLPPELAVLTGLRVLILAFTQITDLNPISDLINLETLQLESAQVSDVSPVAGLTKLRVLGLSGTNVSDISQLSSLINLEHLHLNMTRVNDIDAIRSLSKLQSLGLNFTQITDISSLSGLKKLQSLGLINCMVKDLRPILDLNGLVDYALMGLQFETTDATKYDSRLAELTRVKDHQDRARQTLDYLRSLPPWPAPYTPATTPDGSPPQPIGGASEQPKVKAAKAQIRHLLQNPMLTRLTAQQFAGQIKDALRDVPATNGNYLAEPLQTMLEFAVALEGLAPASEPATDPLDRAKLELRIAQLESHVMRLTQQLQDETKAREAAEALAGKGLFGRGLTEESGKQTAQLVYWVPKIVVGVGVYQAATYFLGVGNPVLEVFSSCMGKGAN
ncbi:MAG: leucine-rich repeat domain-containing protein [Pararhodobacter sp.]|nr:leucine-rich repeat domain-containing protein [Pararhodobacter sp.]